MLYVYMYKVKLWVNDFCHRSAESEVILHRIADVARNAVLAGVVCKFEGAFIYFFGNKYTIIAL